MQLTTYPIGGIGDSEFKRAEALYNAGFKKFESYELKSEQYGITGFPEPYRAFMVVSEADKKNMETFYYWMLRHCSDDFNMPYSMKVTDTTAATVSSSSFGDMQARLGAQQGNVTNYLATLGKMTKDLFSVVRELRQLRERLGYYKDSKLKDNKKVADVAEKTLKGIWVDLVENGTQNPSSVLGLAQKVGFTILPDLFFSAPPMREDEVEAYIKLLDFNDQIKNILARKLFQYYRWKKETHDELKNKKTFLIRYLRQHFDTMRMYIAWLKPYLRHVEMLHLDQQAMEHDARLVSSYQAQISEIETLVYANPIGGHVHPVVSMHFINRSMPSLDFHAKEAWQQKGPIHVGRTEVVLRSYGWTPKQLEAYAKMRKQEDFYLLETIDDNLRTAVQSLGEDIIKFLKETDMDLPDDWLPESMRDKKEEDEPKPESIYDPFIDAGKGMVDIFKPLFPWNFSNPFSGGKKEDEELAHQTNEARGKAHKYADAAAWQTYKNFKKANKFFSW